MTMLRRAQMGLWSWLVLLSAGSGIAAGQEHGGGSSPFAGDFGNALWTLIIFGLVVFVLGKFAWPHILTALQKREQFIHDSLAQAKADREAAEANLKELEQKLQAGRAEATAIVDEGRRDAEVVKQRIQKETRDEADAMLQRAKREIEIARDTAVKDLYDLTANLATDVAGRIVSKELDPAGHQELMTEAINALGGLRPDRG